MTPEAAALIEPRSREAFLFRLQSLAGVETPGAWENEYRAIQGNPLAEVAYQRTQSRIAALTAIELGDQIRNGLLTRDGFLGIAIGIKQLTQKFDLPVAGEAGRNRDVMTFVKAVLEFVPSQAQAAESTIKPDVSKLTRRQFLKLLLGAAGGVVVATTFGGALMVLDADKTKGRSADFDPGSGPVPGDEGEKPRTEAGESTSTSTAQPEQPVATEEPPKDLFRDVWAPAVLTWANERAQQKQVGDPEFLARIDPAFLPIDAEKRTGRVNFLILGEGGEGLLTDVMMVFSYDAAGNQIDLLSLPRDLYAPEAGRRINGAFYLGGKNDGDGFGLTEKIVEDATGLPIHFGGYMKMEAVASMIDAIGGIDIDVPQQLATWLPEADGYATPKSNFTIEAGQQHFDGALALRYARSRLGNDDFSRQRRQKEIIQAVLAEVKSDKKATAEFLGYLLFGVDQQVQNGNLQFDVDLGQARGRIFGVGISSVIPAVKAQFKQGVEIGLPTMGQQMDMRTAGLYETGRIEGDQYLMTVIGAESFSDPTRYWGPVRQWVLTELGR